MKRYTPKMLMDIEGVIIREAPRLPYHNLFHIFEVTRNCKLYAKLEKLSLRMTHLLQVGGLLHDIVYVNGRKDNEERSVLFAQKLMKQLGYEERDILQVKKLIMATKLPPSPKTLYEKVICDADLTNLGRDNFFEWTERFRRELGVDKKEWYEKLTPQFMAESRFYTHSAQRLLNFTFRKNIRRLRSFRWQEL
jgi:adenylate cyclase